MSLRVGIDTGGTFTDLVISDGSSVSVAAKSLTTYDDLANGLLKTLEKAAPEKDRIHQVVHGTTVALNAILTRKGVDAGLITTQGFRDLLDMARGWRPAEALFDPRWRRSQEVNPIIERYRRREVAERVAATGEVKIELDEKALLQEVEQLVAAGCKSIAICFLHSYKHPEHEQKAAALIRQHFPEIGVSTSSGVAPYPREYNRFSTCALNAYVQPLMESYSRDVEGRLSAADISAPLSFMTNDGGLSTPAQVAERPVATLNSGPVGGVMGVQAYSEQLGIPNLVGFDMGGTSTEVSVIVDGKASVKRELEIEHDLLVSLPVMEIHSIGAGGGSLVSLDEGGGLKVGPESARSDPGPACYGRGGQQPTVTDAVLKLGVLDPAVPLGGEIFPDMDAAEKAFGLIAPSLGVSTTELAGTVLELAIHNMAEAVRRLTVYRGVDPREFSLIAYGAAGPLVATQVARTLQMPRVVIPALSGVFSAYGLLSAAAFEEEVVQVMGIASEPLAEELFSRAQASLARLAEKLTATGCKQFHTECRIDATYLGQRWELAAMLDPTHPAPLQHIKEAFAKAHQRQFGYSLPADVYVQTLRTRAVATDAKGVLPAALEQGESKGPRRHRSIVIKGETHDNVPIYAAEDFVPNQVLRGPAVIEAGTYTALLVPGDVGTVNEVGDVIIELEEASK